MQRGLGVIASRSESLSRFMSAYARLAKLPPPKLTTLDVGRFVDRVVTLEKAHQIRVVPGPTLIIQADGDQLEQLLINLIRNALDAVRETGGGVTVGWNRLPGSSRLNGTLGGRRRTRTVEYGEPVRAVLHDETWRVRYRARSEPADRRGARRQSAADEPRGPARLPRELADAGACHGHRRSARRLAQTNVSI